MTKEKIQSILTCHSALGAESSGKDSILPEANKDVRVAGSPGQARGRRASGESGRSMVEMLGTLAIMGVLSVGAVAGYRWAMDKLNANTIVNEVRKRAVTASQQRLLGRDIDLREYGSPDMISGAYQVYPLDRYNNSASFFGIDVTSVPQGICDHILKNKPAQCIEVLVNDTKTDTCPDGESDLTFAFANNFDPNVAALPDAETRCYDNSDCPDSAKPICGRYEYCEPCPRNKPNWDGTTCQDPCPDETPKWNGRSCEACSGSKPAWNGTDCVECTTNEQCANNTNGTYCQTGLSADYAQYNNTCGCLSNDACGADYYCEINAERENLGTGDNGTCYTNYTGKCTNRTMFTESDKIELQASDETIPYATVYKGPKMTWWSAVNYCASQKNPITAQAMILFDVSNNRLKCYHTEDQITAGIMIGTSGTNKWGACNLSENGFGIFSPGTTRSFRMQAFQSKFSSGYSWANGLFNNNGSTTCSPQNCHSCSAFAVYNEEGRVSSYYLNTSHLYALCE